MEIDMYKLDRAINRLEEIIHCRTFAIDKIRGINEARVLREEQCLEDLKEVYNLLLSAKSELK